MTYNLCLNILSYNLLTKCQATLVGYALRASVVRTRLVVACFYFFRNFFFRTRLVIEISFNYMNEQIFAYIFLLTYAQYYFLCYLLHVFLSTLPSSLILF